MKKKLFTTILAIAVAATTLFSNNITTKAAEQKVNPLVQQLNALTGNYIGYDMTYADKVKVLNACFASSAAMQNYTLVVEPSYAYNLISQINTVVETKPATRVTKTFLYDHGNYMFDYSDSITGAHSNSFYTPNSLHMYIKHGAYPTLSKSELTTWYNTNNLDVNYRYRLSDWLNVYTLEQFATVAQYVEIDGVPYLVCAFQPETEQKVGGHLGYGETFDSTASSLTISIALNNYGSFRYEYNVHIFAGPKDPNVPNGHYMYRAAASYTNVNTTTIPAAPANYVKVF